MSEVIVRGRQLTTDLEVGAVVRVQLTPRVQAMIDAGMIEVIEEVSDEHSDPPASEHPSPSELAERPRIPTGSQVHPSSNGRSKARGAR